MAVSRRLLEACWQSVRVPVKMCLDAEYRSIVRLRLFRARDVHQTTPLTWPDRYPAIFGACQRHLASRTDLRLLSYGCSTGEEVVTLRRYFPTACLTGAEINGRSLARCRRLVVDDRIAFVRSDYHLLSRRGPFDAIFCMAVLQRTPHAVDQEQLTSLTRVYPFEKFDRALVRLDTLLKPGGLMVIHHAHYDFEDATVGKSYDPLNEGPMPMQPIRFDRHGHRKIPSTRSPAIFVKRSEGRPVDSPW